MSASSAATSHLSGSSSIQAFAAPLAATSAALSNATATGLDSTLLLNGQKAVTIVHNGTPYRLQATKLGKLILTK